jgi:hypothetical protein
MRTRRVIDYALPGGAAVHAQTRLVPRHVRPRAKERVRNDARLTIWELKDRAVRGARELGHLNPQTQETTIELRDDDDDD